MIAVTGLLLNMLVLDIVIYRPRFSNDFECNAVGGTNFLGGKDCFWIIAKFYSLQCKKGVEYRTPLYKPTSFIFEG